MPGGGGGIGTSRPASERRRRGSMGGEITKLGVPFLTGQTKGTRESFLSWRTLRFMVRKIRKAKPSIFQLRITLKEVEAPVWRRVLVSSDITLDELHLVLNEAMGWTNSHLHQFVFDGRQFADPEFDEERRCEDERAVRLDELAGVGDRFTYEYDFGD